MLAEIKMDHTKGGKLPKKIPSLDIPIKDLQAVIKILNDENVSEASFRIPNRGLINISLTDKEVKISPVKGITYTFSHKGEFIKAEKEKLSARDATLENNKDPENNLVIELHTTLEKIPKPSPIGALVKLLPKARVIIRGQTDKPNGSIPTFGEIANP